MEAAGRRDGRERGENRGTPLPSLKEMRRRRGLTQRDLGALAKVSPGTIFRLENGLRGAYPKTVRKIAAALGVRPADLVRDGRPRIGRRTAKEGDE